MLCLGQLAREMPAVLSLGTALDNRLPPSMKTVLRQSHCRDRGWPSAEGAPEGSSYSDSCSFQPRRDRGRTEHGWQSRDPALETFCHSSFLHSPASAASPFPAWGYFSPLMPSSLTDPYISHTLQSCLHTHTCFFCTLSTARVHLKPT